MEKEASDNREPNDLLAPAGNREIPDEGLVHAVARQAVVEQQRTLDAIRDSFRRFSEKRQQEFHFPYIVQRQNILQLNEQLVDALKLIDENLPHVFLGSLRLNNRREILFSSIDNLVNWNEPDKHWPVSVSLSWRYTYSPPESEIPIPFTYKVEVAFETQPDTADKNLHIVEESISMVIEGPRIEWVRNLNEALEAAIELTKMPWWWNLLRTATLRMRPFVNNGVYVYLIFMAWTMWGVVYSDVEKSKVAQDILAEADMASKYDLYIQHWATPVGFVKYFVFMGIAMLICGALHLLIMVCYNYISPPSLVAIGPKGVRRKLIVKVYGAVWMLVIGGLVSALISTAF